MGTTFVKYDDNGFWIRDSMLELWLRFASLNIEEPTDEMLKEDAETILGIRNQWLLASRGYFGGCVPSCIDEYAKTEFGKRVISKCATVLLDKLKKYPLTIDENVVNLLGNEGFVQMGDLDTWRLIEVGQAIIDLLNGMKFGGADQKDVPMPGCGDDREYMKWRNKQ